MDFLNKIDVSMYVCLWYRSFQANKSILILFLGMI